MRFETFSSLTLFGRRHYFRLVSEGNNETIAQSEGYNSPRDRDIAIKMIRHGAFEAPVREAVRKPIYRKRIA